MAPQLPHVWDTNKISHDADPIGQIVGLGGQNNGKTYDELAGRLSATSI